MIDSLRLDSEPIARLWSPDRETFNVFLGDISGDAMCPPDLVRAFLAIASSEEWGNPVAAAVSGRNPDEGNARVYGMIRWLNAGERLPQHLGDRDLDTSLRFLLRPGTDAAPSRNRV